MATVKTKASSKAPVKSAPKAKSVQAVGFWMGVVAFLKVLIWPVFVVKALLAFLNVK